MGEHNPGQQGNYAHLEDVRIDVDCELGRKTMNLKAAAKLRTGDIIELDKLAGEPFDIRVNGQLFASGEIVVVTDMKAVRVTSLADLKEADPGAGD
jgi:flagellar motor switch protein FliN